MSELGPQLSAFLDGELSAKETLELTAKLAADPLLRAELAALRAANDAGVADFQGMLATPFPLSLVRAMDRNPAPQPRNIWNMPTALAVAACLALIGLGASGGYLVAEQGQTVAARDWVSDIAEYHGVYASQKRHLVEVPAAESAHIKTWLTAQVGTPFDIPDLQSVGLQFQGARLLVAAGKPAGQLMYTDASGRVVALCFVASARPATDGVQTRDTNGFQLRSWDVSGARYVLIAPKDFTDISAIVQAARST